MGLLSTLNRPLDGFKNLNRMLMIVVFPEPDGPINQQHHLF